MKEGVSNTTVESSPATAGLLWKRRATVVVGPTHRRRTWQSQCGWYGIVHSRCLYGPRKGRQAIPDVWYATKLVVDSGSTCWEVISRHRRRGPAVTACEQDAKNERDESQFCHRCGKRPPVYFGVRTLFDGSAQLCQPCGVLFNRPPRLQRLPPLRNKSVPRRKPPLAPEQMSFAFVDETPQ